MPAFRELDPEIIRKALEGHEDVLTPMAKKEDAFFRNTSCPVCGSRNHEVFLNTKNPFTAGVPLPNKLLKCVQCQSEFDPYSNIVTRAKTESD
jgi:hypothetical protein